MMRMSWLCRSLLGAALVALAGIATGTPVTYMYIGTITTSSGYSGVNVGDPITITVTYDPTTGPPSFTGTATDGSTYSYIEDYNGSFVGKPWSTWMTVTASFDAYTWQNNLTGTYQNVGEEAVYDGGTICGPGCYEDLYSPFYVVQYATPPTSGGAEKQASWSISNTSTTDNLDLTHGVSFPQAIDLSKGTQFGEVYSFDPAAGTQYVEFNLNQNGIDLPVPEPATLALLGIGLAGLAATRRRKPN